MAKALKRVFFEVARLAAALLTRFDTCAGYIR
jgi:hypothetical protein